jgi:hypothetical protein
MIIVSVIAALAFLFLLLLLILEMRTLGPAPFARLNCRDLRASFVRHPDAPVGITQRVFRQTIGHLLCVHAGRRFRGELPAVRIHDPAAVLNVKVKSRHRSAPGPWWCQRAGSRMVREVPPEKDPPLPNFDQRRNKSLVSALSSHN